MGSQFPFSKRRIEALEPPAAGRDQYRDSKTPGLVLRVSAAGSKTFSVYKKANGRPVRYKLGTFPEMTIEQARKRTAETLGDIAKGKDPAAARRDAPVVPGELDGPQLRVHERADHVPGSGCERLLRGRCGRRCG